MKHALPGNKYFILVTGVKIKSQEEFIVQLKNKVPKLQEVKTVKECDFILVFCPVVTRAGTDIEKAEQQIEHTSGSQQYL